MRKRLCTCVLICFSLLFISCSDRDGQILDRLFRTETGEYAGEEIDAERIKELEEHIKRYSDETEQLVKDTGKLGIYYKMLALDYMDEEMYGPAVEYFGKALEIYPNNHVLHYYMGLSQSQFAGAQEGEDKRIEMLNEAAYHHQRAVELKPDYFDALYALSVLYIFELDKPIAAEEYVQRALAIKPKNVNTLFLLARIRVIQGRFEEAVEVYDRIIEESESVEVRNRATENRDRIIGGAYDG